MNIDIKSLLEPRSGSTSRRERVFSEVNQIENDDTVYAIIRKTKIFAR